MRGAVLYAPHDVRVDDRPRSHGSSNRPTPSSGSSATCICGSDLWPYRGIEPVDGPAPMGHEYVGIVEEVGADGHDDPARPVRHRFVLRLRQHLRDLPGRLPDRCVHRRALGAIGTQAEWARIPLADGTLVATPDVPARRPHPQLAGRLRRARHRLVWRRRGRGGPGKAVAVVGDGAVGLLGVMAAKQLGAERIIVMSRHRDPPEARASSSAPPTSSKNAATRAPPESRTSPTGSAPTRSSRRSAPESR